MKSRPVLIWNSVLAALQVLSAAGGLSDVLGPTIFFLFSIGVAAVQVGFNTYVQGITVPLADTAAYTNGDGQTVAGPAAGVTNGQEVNVTPKTTMNIATGTIRANSIQAGTITGDDLSEE